MYQYKYLSDMPQYMLFLKYSRHNYISSRHSIQLILQKNGKGMCVLILCCSQVRGVQPLFIPTRTLNPVKDEVPYSRSNFKVTSFFCFFFLFFTPRLM
jgi:hypothetical protein